MSCWRCFEIYGEDDLLALSGLQHFSYCPRQWALIHLEGVWNDNALTAQGNALHERVHDAEESQSSGGVLIQRSLALRCLRLGLQGVADVVEFHPGGLSGPMLPYPVEYKRGRTKAEDCDRVQLCAQALCLEEMMGCTIAEGSLFYGETRRRERVQLDTALRAETEALCAQMRRAYESRRLPAAQTGAKCKACSLRNECSPGSLKRSAARYWEQSMSAMRMQP